MSDWHSAAREADGRTDEEIMAEIKYRADTGAGTPHQHQSFRERDACPECRAAMAAARSRPATDPAGLDVERLRGALTTIRDLCDMDHDEMDAEFGSEQRVRIVVIPAVVDDAIGTRAMSEGLRRVLFRLFSYLGSDLPAARLSVADGPGPEERLREAAQAIADRSPIDTVPDALDEWCHYCNSAREAHEPTCEWAALRAALSRPLPQNREEPSR